MVIKPIGPLNHVDLHILSNLNCKYTKNEQRYLNFRYADIQSIRKMISDDMQTLQFSFGSKDFALNLVIRENVDGVCHEGPRQFTSFDGNLVYEFWIDDYLDLVQADAKQEKKEQ